MSYAQFSIWAQLGRAELGRVEFGHRCTSMQNFGLLAQKMSELCSKKLNATDRQTDRQTDRPTDICISRAPMELKMAELFGW